MEIKKCEVTSEQLLAYLESPAGQPQIATHLESCSVCRQKLAYLTRSALAPYTDHLTCGQCQSLLPDYLQAQTEGQDAATLFPAVQTHLSLCPHCQSFYQDGLKLESEIESLILAGEPVGLPAYRAPNLSFLRRAQGPTGVEEIIRRGAYWLQNQTHTLILDMHAFFQSPLLQPVPVRAARRTVYKPDEETYQIVLGPEHLDDLDVEVTVHRQAEKPEVARVVIHVRIPSRLLAGFAGSQVQMASGETTQVVQTDDDGLAVFEDVPLADLKESTFTIIPA